MVLINILNKFLGYNIYCNIFVVVLYIIDYIFEYFRIGLLGGNHYLYERWC